MSDLLTILFILSGVRDIAYFGFAQYESLNSSQAPEKVGAGFELEHFIILAALCIAQATLRLRSGQRLGSALIFKISELDIPSLLTDTN